MSVTSSSRSGTKRPRKGRSSQQALRMLNIVPWIAAHDGPLVSEVCARFGVTPSQLVEDLEVVQLVGLPPYTPDMLIEVGFEGDRVWVRFADVFARPLRLTPHQALGLVAAGAALTTDSDESTPLATGLAKLAALLGIAPEEAITIRLGASCPDVLDTLRRAVQEHRRVRLDYYSYGRDERTMRDVDPYRIFAADGAWYVVGHCYLAKGQRLFRVDRISAVEVLDTTFESAAAAAAITDVFAVEPDAPTVTLELQPAARWVVETYPVEAVEELEDGTVQVRLTVASRAWLERLLVRLGPDAHVRDTSDPTLADAGRTAARRILVRYTDHGTS